MGEFIRKKKIVQVEDVAIQFGLKVQETVDAILGTSPPHVKELEANGQLNGVMDDRGKFIHITSEEMDTMARYIQQQGRIPVEKFAAEAQRLIRLAE